MSLGINAGSPNRLLHHRDLPLSKCCEADLEEHSGCEHYHLLLHDLITILAFFIDCKRHPGHPSVAVTKCGFIESKVEVDYSIKDDSKACRN